MQLSNAVQTGSDDTWNFWTITGTHSGGSPWELKILVEIDGRDLEIDETSNLDDRQASEALDIWQNSLYQQ